MTEDAVFRALADASRRELLDRLYAHGRRELPEQLPLLPSDYLRRQVRATIQLDSFAVRHRVNVYHDPALAVVAAQINERQQLEQTITDRLRMAV